MAQIFPFRALRYNPAQVEVEKAVTQPYDKITPAMQAHYYDASPHNLVRILLGRPEAGDGEKNNVYTRAAEYLRAWRAQGVLAQDRAPAVYVYSQQFTVPGTTQPAERRGFIAAGGLYDYGEKVVFRHERTLAKPKSDRLNLLRATRAHFGQIFMLYSDSEQRIAPLLNPSLPPLTSVLDEYGVLHQLWPLTDPGEIARLQHIMLDKRLIIADGHHRYETALAYRNERRAACAHREAETSAACDHAMMTFVNMESPGLVILPTHRVLSGLSPSQRTQLLSALEPYFSRADLPAKDLDRALQHLGEAGNTATALLLATADSLHLLSARPEKISVALAHLSPLQRQLDVAVLHKLVLESILGFSEESIRNQENISYYRDAAEAVSRLHEAKPAADVAFLMNPVPIARMRDIAFAGEVMPQKSTDFYPKLLSGLTIYALD
jgi:uncharacterized protein (DUF1015 family)